MGRKTTIACNIDWAPSFKAKYESRVHKRNFYAAKKRRAFSKIEAYNARIDGLDEKIWMMEDIHQHSSGESWDTNTTEEMDEKDRGAMLRCFERSDQLPIPDIKRPSVPGLPISRRLRRDDKPSFYDLNEKIIKTEPKMYVK